MQVTGGIASTLGRRLARLQHHRALDDFEHDQLRHLQDPSTWRRSIYAYVKRNLKYPMFEVFDQPDAALSCERREVTTVPTQALTLFNNEFFLLQAKHFAERVVREGGTDPAAQIKRVCRIAFSREPSARELNQGIEFLKKQGNTSLAEFAHVLFNTNEFLYIN